MHRTACCRTPGAFWYRPKPVLQRNLKMWLCCLNNSKYSFLLCLLRFISKGRFKKPWKSQRTMFLVYTAINLKQTCFGANYFITEVWVWVKSMSHETTGSVAFNASIQKNVMMTWPCVGVCFGLTCNQFWWKNKFWGCFEKNCHIFAVSIVRISA